jgi:hypothetical protein
MKKIVDSILLDSRFGLRMLMKHRGLTVVGVFATAVAIAVGATLFEVFSELLGPTLPFTDSSRIVGVQFPGPNPDRPERRVIHDFAAFQGQLRSIEHFGAYRNAEYNLVAADTAPEPVTVAEISASVFTIAGVPAFKGRFLLPADEKPSAPPVIVIGHQAWQLRFAGDPAVIGRNVKLGGISRTVVGVMPEDFKFPTNHQFWIPFRAEPLKYARWEGPSIFMLGRLPQSPRWSRPRRRSQRLRSAPPSHTPSRSVPCSLRSCRSPEVSSNRASPWSCAPGSSLWEF